MPVTPGTEHEEAGGVCAGVDLGALVAEARRALDALPGEPASSGAELFLTAERKLTLEHEVSTGASTLSEGESVVAAARVEGEKHWGFAAIPVGTEQDLTGVLDAARNRPPPGVGAPPPSPLPPGEGKGEGSTSPGFPPEPGSTHALTDWLLGEALLLAAFLCSLRQQGTVTWRGHTYVLQRGGRMVRVWPELSGGPG